MSNDVDPAPINPKDLAVEMTAFDKARREVIATSNGHSWIRVFGLTCCRDCGIVRRRDDKNRQCRGVVKVGLR